ncbi:MAG: TRAP transporter small permease subunit, partial [Deltaproteobacteria bacterium]
MEIHSGRWRRRKDEEGGTMGSYATFRHLLSRFLNGVEKILVLFGTTLFTAVVLANGLEIFLRTFGFRSLFWIQEFTVVSCSYMVFLGAAILFKRKGDILVSFVYDRFSKGAQGILSVVVDGLVLIFLGVAIKASYSYLRFVYGGHTQTMKLPVVLVYFPILL